MEPGKKKPMHSLPVFSLPHEGTHQHAPSAAVSAVVYVQKCVTLGKPTRDSIAKVFIGS